MTPKRIQLSRRKGYRKPEGAVVVARPSRWGNPFRIYHGHSIIGPHWSDARAIWTHIPAEQAIHAYITTSVPLGNDAAVVLFRSLLTVRERDEPDRLRQWVAPLRGKDLACWCPLKDEADNPVPCHATVLLEIANFPEVRS